MNPNIRSFCFHLSRHQNGFVLVMSLVFLLLLTILGITAMTTTSLQEKMAFNVKDKTLSFEAAESALRLAETWLSSTSLNKEIFDATVRGNISALDGITKVASVTDAPVWRDMIASGAWNASGGDLVIYPGVPWVTSVASPAPLDTKFYAAQPRYIIEYLNQQNCSKTPLPGENQYGGTNPKCHILYVTAFGVGGTMSAVSMVQSTVNVRTN